ncbi:hypothetical protein HYPBUDRAFT_111012 [Hyphopichia burtonii NRRL Y-1933]|uniref:pH-response transcription factor pacC/RIM101 n=1 Tax=Hyphopichia burtonii NRRL Y-1933 TaxID=984485 RepID=A0A1E4RHJ5_9ASCO|nr:hypothetical protein HYPBUDRAFT_111012 [Hyphopichia burtonii NRRL Y-1933]ODV66747.1 hypothetical protein HYPBUDRAFT_111012 [Hyphopichia burtonii NRRL Y-1933]
MHYDTQHPVLPHLYNYSQQQPKTYPISPASLPASLNDKESSSSPEKLPIDYSSIVSYTISPSLKRRRRSTKSNSKDIGDMQYSCLQCSKVFQKAYNLKSHMKTHSTEKPFKCSICSKAFARSHDKKRHELLHAGKKNFKCEGFLKDGKTRWGCGKKFARSDALSRHFRTETGWLCIKPLMDEAKTLDAQKIPKTEEFYDNSNFIRRLIQK